MTLSAKAELRLSPAQTIFSKISIESHSKGETLNLSKKAFAQAYLGFSKIIKKNPNYRSDILSIVDFSLDINKKRLFVIDLKKEELLFKTWVGHAEKADTKLTGKPQLFSNKPGSRIGSLGFFVTAKSHYRGKFGKSLRIHGLDSELNKNVLKRAIVVHGDDRFNFFQGLIDYYGSLDKIANSEQGQKYYKDYGVSVLPLSWGCFNIPFRIPGQELPMVSGKTTWFNHYFIKLVKGESIIFSYSPTQELSKSSKWLKK